MQMKYQKDAKILKFNTRVKSVEEMEDGVYVELEESYFYPEGGGQLKDEGTINGKEVMDLIMTDGVLYHKVPSFSGLTLNMQVNCIIDEKVREAHTVTHTAQHVLSAVLKDEYNLNTIGFHMGKQSTTIDVDGAISLETLLEVEDRVNTIIRDDLKVKIYFRTLKEAQRLPLRKAIKDLDDVRIVQIGDLDYSGCGGTHVASLKEIQLLKVMDMEKYKGGLRISFAAGQRALDYIKELEATMRLLKEELNTSMDEMPYRVRRLKEEKADEHLRAENLQKQMVFFMANNYDEDIIVEKVDYDEEMIKALGKEIMALDKIAFFYTDEQKVYLFTGKRCHGKKVLDEAKADLDFRGGAGAHFGQGIFEKEEDLLTFISNLYGVFLKLEI